MYLERHPAEESTLHVCSDTAREVRESYRNLETQEDGTLLHIAQGRPARLIRQLPAEEGKKMGRIRRGTDNPDGSFRLGHRACAF